MKITVEPARTYLDYLLTAVMYGFKGIRIRGKSMRYIHYAGSKDDIASAISGGGAEILPALRASSRQVIRHTTRDDLSALRCELSSSGKPPQYF